jgi:hypothetical protein
MPRYGLHFFAASVRAKGGGFLASTPIMSRAAVAAFRLTH